MADQHGDGTGRAHARAIWSGDAGTWYVIGSPDDGTNTGMI